MDVYLSRNGKDVFWECHGETWPFPLDIPRKHWVTSPQCPVCGIVARAKRSWVKGAIKAHVKPLSITLTMD